VPGGETERARRRSAVGAGRRHRADGSGFGDRDRREAPGVDRAGSRRIRRRASGLRSGLLRGRTAWTGFEALHVTGS
jgi:hypothetical protein